MASSCVPNIITAEQGTEAEARRPASPPENSALRPQAARRRPRAFWVERGKAPSAAPASSRAGGGRISSTFFKSPARHPDRH